MHIKNSNKNLVIIGGSIASLALYLSSALTDLIKKIIPQDSSRFAAAINAQLSDSPSCTRFKSAITEAGKGSPIVPSTKRKVMEVFDAAGVAGCKKETTDGG